MQRIISFVLSVLILLSSSGLVYATHYCGAIEMVSKVTLGEGHLSCGMVMETSPCGDEHETEGHFCCNNTYLKVATDDQYAKVSFDFDFSTQWFVLPETIFVPVKLGVSSSTYPTFPYDHPPPLERNIQVWFQTFLI